jgi:hypothetical protein
VCRGRTQPATVEGDEAALPQRLSLAPEVSEAAVAAPSHISHTAPCLSMPSWQHQVGQGQRHSLNTGPRHGLHHAGLRFSRYGGDKSRDMPHSIPQRVNRGLGATTAGDLCYFPGR